MKRYLFILLSLLLGLSSYSQLLVDFETTRQINGIGVYDTWEKSPFNTGELKGNVAIVDNPIKGYDPVRGKLVNSSARVLGAQRSRFGSNHFGVRVDLKTPLRLSADRKCIHLNLLRPVSGKVMLIGLGRSRDWNNQPNDVVQFMVKSSSNMVANTWSDAAFEIKVAGNIDIYSLVVVPHCESPHLISKDFLFYIDNIALSDSRAPMLPSVEPYSIILNKGAKIADVGKGLDKVTFKTKRGEGAFSINQSASGALYKYLTDSPLILQAGEELEVVPDFTGVKGNAYLYIDVNKDGIFSLPSDNEVEKEEVQDLIAYSFYNGKDSEGEDAEANSVKLPKIKIPDNMKPGAYRMRLKIEENALGPWGENRDEALEQCGAIVDFPLFICEDQVTVNAQAEHGVVVTKANDEIKDLQTSLQKPFSIRITPDNGYFHHGINLTYGFNIDSQSRYDSLGNVQSCKKSLEFEGDTYQIPGWYMCGRVGIEGIINRHAGPNGRPLDPEIYGLNFPENTTNKSLNRQLQSFTLWSGQYHKTFIIDTEQNTIWQNLTKQGPFFAEPGMTVSSYTEYQGGWMHIYQYVDWNRNGVFDVPLDTDGMPVPGGELMGFTYYKGKNSSGEVAEPGVNSIYGRDFVIPGNIPDGIYNARFKIDWDNIDPKGAYSGEFNYIDDNGGCVADFYIEVKRDESNSAVLAPHDNSTLRIELHKGHMILSSDTPTITNVHDIMGRRIYANRRLEGSVDISLQPGIYIVNHKRVCIK